MAEFPIDPDSEQNIEEQEIPLRPQVDNSQGELLRMKYVLDAQRQNSVEVDGPAKEVSIDEIKKTLATTKHKQRANIKAAASDEIFMAGFSDIQFAMSAEGGHMTTYAVDSLGEPMGELMRTPIEDIVCDDNDFLNCQNERSGSTPKSQYMFENPEDVASRRSKLTSNRSFELIGDDTSGVQLVPHDLGLPDGLDIERHNINTHADVYLAIVQDLSLLPESEGIVEDEGEDYTAKLITTIINEGTEYNPVKAQFDARLKAKKALEGNFDPKNLPGGIMMVDLKNVAKRGGDPAKASEFFFKNKFASVAEGMGVVGKIFTKLKSHMSSAGVKNLSETESAVAVTAGYVGGNFDISPEYVKHLTGKKGAKPVNLKDTSHKGIAMNVSRQIQAALLYDTSIEGFENIDKSPNSVAYRIWNMPIKFNGKTKSAKEWITEYRSEDGSNTFHKKLQQEYSLYDIQPKRSPEYRKDQFDEDKHFKAEEALDTRLDRQYDEEGNEVI